MDSAESMESQVAEARARLESTRAAVARARADLSAASTTARSKDRSVEVTVGPQGELKRVKFLEDKYKTMEAAQLAAAIVEASDKGRAAMARRVIDTFSSINTPDLETADGTYRPPDWQQIFGPALSTQRKRRGGRPAASLHDELTEEGGDV